VSEAEQRPEFRLIRVPVDAGVELAVTAWGAAGPPEGGPDRARTAAPIVLLHGVAASARAWDAVARRLATAGHTVFAVDFRGHGESDAPETGYDLATFASDVASTLNGLALDRPFIAGHSLGAMVMLEAPVSRFSRGVALIEGGLVDASVQFATLDEALAGLALPPVDGMPRARVEGFLRATNPGWSAERLAGTMASFETLPDGTVRWRLTRPRLESLIRSMWDQHAPGLWPRLEVPALIVAADTGDAAWTERKRDAAAAALRSIPTSRLAWLTADHDVHMACPEEVAALLLDAAGKAPGA
jgi:pimeloyl-ACP methyl ester carboxylesterase